MTKQKIRVENGFGDAVGMLVLDGELFTDEMEFPRSCVVEWTQKRYYSVRTYTVFKKSLRVNVERRISYGFCVMLKWKDRMKLQRAGLLLPYNEEEALRG